MIQYQGIQDTIPYRTCFSPTVSMSKVRIRFAISAIAFPILLIGWAALYANPSIPSYAMYTVGGLAMLSGGVAAISFTTMAHYSKILPETYYKNFSPFHQTDIRCPSFSCRHFRKSVRQIDKMLARQARFGRLQTSNVA